VQKVERLHGAIRSVFFLTVREPPYMTCDYMRTMSQTRTINDYYVTVHLHQIPH